MTTKSNIFFYIENVWAGRPESAICEKLIEYFCVHAETAANLHLTWSLLQKISGAEDFKALSNATHFLAGDRLNLLYHKFEYVDESGRGYEVDAADVAACISTGNYYDPLSGELTTQSIYLQSVLPYFVPTEELLSLSNDKSPR